MEEKILNEQESLELITQMINQTKKESAIGSGNMFLIWGYLCTFISLAVFALSFIQKNGAWGWLYMAIPVTGFIVAGVVARASSKKWGKKPGTYQSKSITSVWGCLAGIFAIYAVVCLMEWNHYECWSGMFLLGLLLPAIGTYCTGTILKEWSIQLCGIIGAIQGVRFLEVLCAEGPSIELKWALMMAIAMVVTLIIPGHILNYKAKKLN